MKKIIVTVIMLGLLASCGYSENSGTNNSRFIEDVQVNGATGYMSIITDTKTGVSYLFTKVSSGVGLTPLLDADGKPFKE